MLVESEVRIFYLMLLLFIGSSVFPLIFRKKQIIGNYLTNIGCMIASALGFVLSLFIILGKYNNINTESITLNVPYYLSYSLKIDDISAYFMIIFSVVSFLVSLYSISYVAHYAEKKSITIFNVIYPLFLLAMMLVISAGNIILFFMMWEVMSLTSYFLVAYDAEKNEVRDASTLYIIMTHIGTAFLMIAFVMIYVYTGSFDFDEIKDSIVQNPMPSSLKNTLFVLVMIGFGTKAGVVPLHVWLPKAHPAAPGNVSALMSSIMLKTAIYGMVRFLFEIVGIGDSWWGIAILTVGIISVLYGVSYAFFEKNIKKLLAYSSIENIGIILMGLGVSAIGISTSNLSVYTIAFTAAMVHTLNHAVFKSLLFLCTASVDYSTHTKNLDELGGLMKKMPYTGFCLLIGSLSISAVIPFNGFIGEWLNFQGFLLAIIPGKSVVNLMTITGAIALAFAGVLGAGAYIKMTGIGFLGEARSDKATNAREVPMSMKLPKMILGLLCLLLGIMPGVLINFVSNTFGKVLYLGDINFTENGFIPMALSSIQVNAGINRIAPLMVIVVASICLICMVAYFRFIGRKAKIREYGTWDCGFIQLNKRMQYTAAGFAKPVGWILRFLYGIKRTVTVTPGISAYFPESIKYSLKRKNLIEDSIYNPIAKFITRFSRKSRLNFQTGSMHMYLNYIFITILLLLVYNKMV